MALDVFDYQKEAAAVMAPKARFGLFDSMGVGKTATAIRAADMASAKRGLVICPAGLRENWKREFMRFQTVERSIVKVNSMDDMIAWTRGRFDIACISFEKIANWAELFNGNLPYNDVSIIDEGHFLKNVLAKRTQKILGDDFDGHGGVIGWSLKSWWLTGSPAPNGSSDIYTWLQFLDGPMRLSFQEFIETYFRTQPSEYGGRHSVRLETLNDLQAVIKEWSIARTMDEAGIQLPPIFLTDVVVDGNDAEIQRVLREYPELDVKLLRAVEEGTLVTLKGEHVAVLRRIIGEAKAIPYAANLAFDLLHGGLDKCVVFGLHKKVLENVRAYLLSKGIDCVLYYGGTSESARTAAVDRFNENPNCRVFLGNIRSAGVGLNLQSSCCNIDMLESDWSPAANAQAIKRIARLGQTRSMRARFIAMNHWTDEAVTRSNIAKTNEIAHLGLPALMEMERQEETMQIHRLADLDKMVLRDAEFDREMAEALSFENEVAKLPEWLQ